MMSAAALCSLMCLFFFASSGHPRALHSFPTRRSSDLERAPPPMVAFASQTSTEHPARASVIAAAITLARAGCSVLDRKSTRLNSSHTVISYAVFCLKKKKKRQKLYEIYKIAHEGADSP